MSDISKVKKCRRSHEAAHVGGDKFLGMKHLKLVQVKIGKEGKTICHFSPKYWRCAEGVFHSARN